VSLWNVIIFPFEFFHELGPMYATDRRQTKASLDISALWGRRHNNQTEIGFGYD